MAPCTFARYGPGVDSIFTMTMRWLARSRCSVDGSAKRLDIVGSLESSNR